MILVVCSAADQPVASDPAQQEREVAADLIESSKSTKILIIGAGVAGCILTRVLSSEPSLDVLCLEKVARNDHQNAGTGLNIGPNASKALARTCAELKALLDQRSLPWRDWKMHLSSGRELFNVSLDEVAGGSGWRISWSELYEVLRSECGDLVRFGASTSDVSRQPDGRLSIAWSDTDEKYLSEDVDLLIAADGRFSATRRTFVGVPRVSHLGVVIFRMLVPDTSGALIGDHEQWFNGPNRLLAFKIKPDQVYIAGSFPIDPSLPIPYHAKDPRFLRELYLPTDQAAAPAVEWLVENICRYSDSIHWARMQEQEILYADPSAPVLYVGDAAHGMIPTLGQGASQAIEDACAISDMILREVAAGHRDVRAWMAGVETLRTDRMRFVMDFSRDASDTMLPDVDVEAGTLKKMESEFQSNLRRLYQDI
jgi:salicylate hydroxylase